MGTKIRFRELVKAYEKAKKKNKKVIKDFGTELLTDYTKYLIEYLESRCTHPDQFIEFNPQGKPNETYESKHKGK